MSKILSLTLVLTLLAVSFAADAKKTAKPAAKASVKVAAKPAAKASVKVAAKPAAKAGVKVTAKKPAAKKSDKKSAKPAKSTGRKTIEHEMAKPGKFAYQVQLKSTHTAAIADLKKAIIARGRGIVRTIRDRFIKKIDWEPTMIAWAKKIPRQKNRGINDVANRQRFLWRYLYGKSQAVFEVIELVKFKSKNKPQLRVTYFKRYDFCENAFKKLGLNIKDAQFRCEHLGLVTKRTAGKIAFKKAVKKMIQPVKKVVNTAKAILTGAAARLAKKIAKKQAKKDKKPAPAPKKVDKKKAAAKPKAKKVKVDTKAHLKSGAALKKKRAAAKLKVKAANKAKKL